MLYTYFPDDLFTILHISFALMFYCWRYKNIIPKLITLHKVRNYFPFMLLNTQHIKIISNVNCRSQWHFYFI